MRLISLTKVNRDAPNVEASLSDTDDVGENMGAVAAAASSQPCMVNVDAIRCFYARRNDAPGTRLTFTDGGGFAVTETFEEVSAKVAGFEGH